MSFSYVEKLLLLMILTLVSPFVDAEGLKLSPESQLVKEGYYSLRWNKKISNDKWLLQVADTPEFNRLVKTYPLNLAGEIALSGYSDGVFFARIVDSGGASQSNPVTITVHHRELSMAFKLFALGAGLFIFLIVLIFFPQLARVYKAGEKQPE
ncbi:hypothetical protein [Aliikangiella sp. G2MR2-5]|uniref:hypothetical protein n=1 Tax=Aliikangiella sp. G2MR2-5 TaxID=2788943 RepID=UPI0018A9947C|nr:hypothetical protein [Aliikangiella sp. G2MR2-5]